jgi:enoyl-CoA hydratase/carnithine racemase
MGDLQVKRASDGDVIALTFSSGHRLNPLTRSLVTELLGTLKELRAAPPAVLTIQGGENFSCGAHTGELAAMSPSELDAFIAEEIELCEVVASLPAVTIAAIRGVCVGNAAELAVACDLRLACEDASFAWPEVTIGYPAPVRRLAQLTGRGPATQLALLGERITAARACQLGLVSELIDPAGFERRLAELASRAAGLPRQAVAQTKRNLDAAFGRGHG